MKLRQSNFEVFRIVAMMGIVAYHAAWYSGLATRAYENPWDGYNVLLLVLGAWGKTGINCFILITGYFMCESKLALGRFLKVIGITEFYAFFVLGVTCFLGWQEFGWEAIREASFQFWNGINGSFVPSYIALLALVPVLNKAIIGLSGRSHALLVIVLLFVFCVLPSVGVRSSLGEIPWFVTLYLVAALIRRREKVERQEGGRSLRMWSGGLAIVLSAAVASMFFGVWLNPRMPGRNMIYWWVFPDMKVLAFGVALCAFMVFKNLRMGSNRFVNVIGGTTFGIYLLHDGVLGIFRERVWRCLISSENGGGGGKYVIVVLTVFCVGAAFDILRRYLFRRFREMFRR